MTEKILVGPDDVARLVAELVALSPDGLDEEDWAERNGLEINTVHSIIGAAVDAAREAFMDIAKERIAEHLEEMDEPPKPGEMVQLTEAVDLGEIIGHACFNCFALGVEIQKQYGFHRE